MSQYIPLKTTEVNGLQLLWGCREVVENDAPRLESRLKACGKLKQYRCVRTMLAGITDALMTTVEPKKAYNFLMNITNHELRVCAKGSIDTTPGRVTLDEDVASRYIMRNLKDRCTICSGTHEDRRKCQLRRDLKVTTLFDVDESCECMGHFLLRKVEDR